ncbi:hypothetical protein Pryu01_02300 [Paraliobacillus ryukyuensis]|uniref:UPF0180 protein DES48_1101 n=1 Tax=Paraliobacillus ryukyuensis TaxID=200904 RepID=A0A366DWP8_9BACI|nr:YkuS family protein [Paraliobacillus ryukyuensis]RBO94516.1 uncharacterized protein UPF0180 [Paraliobacillus ryukyuensis]
MKRVGVEGTLSDVKGALQQKGYDVVDLKQESDSNGCDCCVISGQDKNVMGMQTTNFKGAVINADGLTATQVCEQVDTRFK